MGKSTINGHFQQQTVKLPEGMLTHYGHFIGTFAKIMINQGMVHGFSPTSVQLRSLRTVLSAQATMHHFISTSHENIHVDKEISYQRGKFMWIDKAKNHIHKLKILEIQHPFNIWMTWNVWETQETMLTLAEAMINHPYFDGDG